MALDLDRIIEYRESLGSNPHGALELDLEARTAFWHGKKLTLSPTQFNLLGTLASRPGHIFAYSELYALNTGIRLSLSAARSKLKTHVINLRRKLAYDGYP